MNALTPSQRQTLADCERVIAAGVRQFQLVGSALAKIRDDELFRDTDDDFRTYCKRKWGFSDSRARQLISAVKTVQQLESVTTVTPENERTVRELNTLPVDERGEAWQEAVEQHGNPTAEQTREVVKKRKKEKVPLQPAIGKPCWNCGEVERDEDGECNRCHEPHPEARDEGDSIARLRPEPGRISILKTKTLSLLTDFCERNPEYSRGQLATLVGDWLSDWQGG